MSHSRILRQFFTGILFASLAGLHPTADAADSPMRIIAFGAHPDDCEIRAGGVAAKWAQLGHKVKFVAVTNGDVGHSIIAGGPLAQRRTREVREAAEILGIETQVLDIHDGEVLPTLENRKKLIRIIREWNADIVLTNRPNDYHPDHRYTSILVQDAAFMVTVPFVCPDVPHLRKNPVFLYWADRFQKPNPFEPDVIVDIEDAIDRKFEALHVLESQFYEKGAGGDGTENSFVKGDKETRMTWLRGRFTPYFAPKEAWKPLLKTYYGEDRVESIRFVESFEICEYGRRPSREELRRLFPFFPK